jgi:hypothetical protein
MKHHTYSTGLGIQFTKCNSHSFPIIHFHHQSYRSFFQTRTTSISSIPDTSLNYPHPHNLYPSRGNPSSPPQLKPTKTFSLLLWQHSPRSTEAALREIGLEEHLGKCSLPDQAKRLQGNPCCIRDLYRCLPQCC